MNECFQLCSLGSYKETRRDLNQARNTFYSALESIWRCQFLQRPPANAWKEGRAWAETMFWHTLRILRSWEWNWGTHEWVVLLFRSPVLERRQLLQTSQSRSFSCPHSTLRRDFRGWILSVADALPSPLCADNSLHPKTHAGYFNQRKENQLGILVSGLHRSYLNLPA